MRGWWFGDPERRRHRRTRAHPADEEVRHRPARGAGTSRRPPRLRQGADGSGCQDRDRRHLRRLHPARRIRGAGRARVFKRGTPRRPRRNNRHRDSRTDRDVPKAGDLRAVDRHPGNRHEVRHRPRVRPRVDVRDLRQPRRGGHRERDRRGAGRVRAARIHDLGAHPPLRQAPGEDLRHQGRRDRHRSDHRRSESMGDSAEPVRRGSVSRNGGRVGRGGNESRGRPGGDHRSDHEESLRLRLAGSGNRAGGGENRNRE